MTRYPLIGTYCFVITLIVSCVTMPPRTARAVFGSSADGIRALNGSETQTRHAEQARTSLRWHHRAPQAARRSGAVPPVRTRPAGGGATLFPWVRTRARPLRMHTSPQAAGARSEGRPVPVVKRPSRCTAGLQCVCILDQQTGPRGRRRRARQGGSSLHRLHGLSLVELLQVM